VRGAPYRTWSDDIFEAWFEDRRLRGGSPARRINDDGTIEDDRGYERLVYSFVVRRIRKNTGRAVRFHRDDEGRFTGRRDDQDQLQEAFIGLLKAARRYDRNHPSDSKVHTLAWLAMKNAVRDHRKKAWRKWEGHEVVLFDPFAEDAVREHDSDSEIDSETLLEWGDRFGGRQTRGQIAAKWLPQLAAARTENGKNAIRVQMAKDWNATIRAYRAFNEILETPNYDAVPKPMVADWTGWSDPSGARAINNIERGVQNYPLTVRCAPPRMARQLQRANYLGPVGPVGRAYRANEKPNEPDCEFVCKSCDLIKNKHLGNIETRLCGDCIELGPAQHNNSKRGKNDKRSEILRHLSPCTECKKPWAAHHVTSDGHVTCAPEPAPAPDTTEIVAAATEPGRTIITHLFGGDGVPNTEPELGQILRRTSETVRKTKWKTLAKLAHPSTGAYRPPYLSWMDHGACKGHDAGMWFPDFRSDSGKRQADIAEFVCVNCPVRVQCAAVGANHKEGIFGGLTPAERKQQALKDLLGGRRIIEVEGIDAAPQREQLFYWVPKYQLAFITSSPPTQTKGGSR
jgi:hypothetical protein